MVVDVVVVVYSDSVPNLINLKKVDDKFLVPPLEISSPVELSAAVRLAYLPPYPGEVHLRSRYWVLGTSTTEAPPQRVIRAPELIPKSPPRCFGRCIGEIGSYLDCRWWVEENKCVASDRPDGWESWQVAAECVIFI